MILFKWPHLYWRSYYLQEGYWLGFSVLRFWRFVRSVFWFLCQKTSVFRLWCSLRFADFSFFSIRFSVFVENTSSFSVLLSNVVFGFSYFERKFLVLAEFFAGFAVLDDFFFGFAVSNIPHCPPPTGPSVTFHYMYMWCVFNTYDVSHRYVFFWNIVVSLLVFDPYNYKSTVS